MSTDIQFETDEEKGAPNSMIEVAQSRASQEVQAALVVAKKFPRDPNESFRRIMLACKRPSLAEQALYSFPRGGTTVRGPSIRMAEALAQGWGNINAGVVELSNENGESSMLAYAWDLETNTRIDKVFTVKHVRDTRAGTTKLTDQRDIYEMCANQGARRLRACILGVIPGDVIDAAVGECMNTLRGDGSQPIADRVRVMVTAFGEVGVNQKMIEDRLGHNLDVTTEDELVTLRSIFQSIRDGMADVKTHFKPPARPRPGSAAPAPASTDDLVAQQEAEDEAEADKKAAQEKMEAAIRAAEQDEAKPEGNNVDPGQLFNA